jgi:hypothetical protein
VGGNAEAPLLMLHRTNYAASHNMASSEGFYARMAAMQRQAGSVVVASEAVQDLAHA